MADLSATEQMQLATLRGRVDALGERVTVLGRHL